MGNPKVLCIGNEASVNVENKSVVIQRSTLSDFFQSIFTLRCLADEKKLTQIADLPKQ